MPLAWPAQNPSRSMSLRASRGLWGRRRRRQQRLGSSLPPPSRSGPAARPRLTLTSSTPPRGQAPRPSAGVQRQPPRAWSRCRAASGPRITFPSAASGGRRGWRPRLPIGAGAAKPPSQSQREGPTNRVGEGWRRKREEGARGRRKGREGGEGGSEEVGRIRPLLRGGLSCELGSGRCRQKRLRRDPTFSSEGGFNGGGVRGAALGVQGPLGPRFF